MNGRCDTDPLDPADDVCDLCGGEFCESCLVERTKRTRQTVCKECSLIQARVRPGRIIRVRSKREAKKRRKEIQAERTSMQDEGRFVFFDEGAEQEGEETISSKKALVSQFETEIEALPASVEPSEDPDAWLNQIDDLIEPDVVEPSGDDTFAVPHAPAVDELERLRSNTPEELVPPEALRPTRVEPEVEPEELVTPSASNYDDTDPFANLAVEAPEPSPSLAAATTSTHETSEPEPADIPVPAAFQTSEPEPADIPVPAAFQTSEPEPASDQSEIPEVFRVKTESPKGPEPVAAMAESDHGSAEEWVPPALRG